jgi:DNA-binding IclR family transcriptional regulator
MSKTTVHRILSALCGRGYASKTHEGTYTIGSKMFDTLSHHIDSLELQSEAKPHLIALQRSLGLTSYLGVRDGPFVSIIEKEATDRVDEQFTQVGRRYPAHCSSMGKCLMACLSRDELDEMLYGIELQAFTPYTITHKQAFREHLHQVRRQGWATDIEESELNHRCVAAPVFDYRGDIIAVIGVSAVNDELPVEDIDMVAGRVVLAAQKISSCMGYTD